jgi:hypothetical protein
MRRLHLYTGCLSILIFVLTGLYLRLHPLPDTAPYNAAHLLRRSRHIYILASALLHLMLGLYLTPQPAGWRRLLQTIGSAVLILSTGLLVLAFILEPREGFQPEMWRSRYGLITLLLGCVAHVLSAGQPRRKVI